MTSPPSEHPAFSQTLFYILLSIIGWLAFVIADTISKWLTGYYGVAEVIWGTSLAGLAGLTIWILGRHGWRGFATPRWRWHLARGLNVTGTVFCVINALARTPLADYYALVFLSPILLAIMAHFLLGERMGLHRMIAAIAGFCGVLVVAGPQFGDMHAGLLFALAAAFFISMNGILIRKIGREKVSSLYALFPFLFNSVIYMPFALPGFVIADTAHIPLFIAVAPCVIAGFICYSIAFSRVSETAIIAPFHYTQIIWGALIGYALFGDIPAPATIGGSAIIIGAGLYLIWREHINHKKMASTALPS